LWAFSILGGSPRQLSDEGWSASVSPDGSQIVFLKGAGFAETGQEIWLMRANGADQRKLISFSDGRLATPVWSPDGRWIAYLRNKLGPDGEEPWIEILNLEQGTKRAVLSEPRLSAWGLMWLSDGRLLYALYEPPPSHNSSNFWAASTDLSTGRVVGTPVRITSGDGFVVGPRITADGKHLVFNRARPQADVYVSEFSANGPDSVRRAGLRWTTPTTFLSTGPLTTKQCYSFLIEPVRLTSFDKGLMKPQQKC